VLNSFFVTKTTPEVGMDATVCYVTDRVSTKIVAVSKSGREVTTWDGTAKVGWVYNVPTEGDMFFDESPEYRVWTLRKNGRWIVKGQPMERYATHLLVGVKDDYRDPSF
jgi:hypothetical protein